MVKVQIVAPKKSELRANGTSKKIQVRDGLTEQELLDFGFSNHHNPTLYYSRMVGDEISFNVSIDKKNRRKLAIDVLDEDFMQPFDYQRMIMEGTAPPFALEVYEKVEEEMAKLHEAGILTGHVRGQYI